MKLYRDVSEIQADNNSCNTIDNDAVIYGYTNSNRTRYKYVLVQDKYYKVQTSTSNYGYDVSSYTCLSTSQLESLTSDANSLVPFYGLVAVSLAILVLSIVWFAVKSILGRRV